VSVSDDLSLKIWVKELSKENSNSSWSRTGYSWKCVLTAEGLHSRPIYSVSWSKYNGLIATCGADSSIKISKLYQNEDETYYLHEEANLPLAHDGYDVNCVRWCPLESNSSLLASCGDDEIVRVWSMK